MRAEEERRPTKHQASTQRLTVAARSSLHSVRLSECAARAYFARRRVRDASEHSRSAGARAAEERALERAATLAAARSDVEVTWR